ncbi:MAG: hypothetical protein MHM6MM_009253, partial [Cercozoa sp. M6MM]
VKLFTPLAQLVRSGSLEHPVLKALFDEALEGDADFAAFVVAATMEEQDESIGLTDPYGQLYASSHRAVLLDFALLHLEAGVSPSWGSRDYWIDVALNVVRKWKTSFLPCVAAALRVLRVAASDAAVQQHIGQVATLVRQAPQEKLFSPHSTLVDIVAEAVRTLNALLRADADLDDKKRRLLGMLLKKIVADVAAYVQTENGDHVEKLHAELQQAAAALAL